MSLATDPAPWTRLLESLWVAVLGGACAFCVFEREPVGTFGCAVAFSYAVIASERRRQEVFERQQAARNAERRRPRGPVISAEEARRLELELNATEPIISSRTRRATRQKVTTVTQVDEAIINIPGDMSVGIPDHTIRVSGLLLDADDTEHREELRGILARLAEAVSGGDYATVEFADERAALIAAENAMIQPPEANDE